MAAKLTPQLTNTQVKFVGTRFASRRSAVRKKRSGVNRECHARRRVKTTDRSDPGRRYQDGLTRCLESQAGEQHVDLSFDLFAIVGNQGCSQESLEKRGNDLDNNFWFKVGRKVPSGFAGAYSLGEQRKERAYFAQYVCAQLALLEDIGRDAASHQAQIRRFWIV